MKTPLTYASYGALGGALLTLGLYFAGFHDSAEKLKSAQMIGGLIGFAILIATLVLAIREKRANAPADTDWSYGSAFGAGMLTSLFLILFNAVFTYIYFAIINPGMSDVILAAQQAGMEAKGMSASQIANAEPMMRKFMSPVATTIFQTIFSAIMCVALVAIIAAFFRKPREGALGSEVPPPIA
jgi:hypothetical protein